MIVLVESVATRPTAFVRYASPYYHATFGTGEVAAETRMLLDQHHVPLWEMRERNGQGDHVRRGIATVDVGAPGILPERLQMIRLGLFDTTSEQDFRGYLPLVSGKFPYSWQAISATLRLEPPDVAARLVQDPAEHVEILGNAGTYAVVRDLAALPRAYFTRQCVFTADPNAALKTMQDPTTYQLGLAVLEASPEAAREVCIARDRGDAETGPGYSQVTITEDQGHRLTLSAVQGPGVVVLNDNFDPGWRAVDRVSHQDMRITHVNVAFRGLLLNERRAYDLEFRYEPRWLTASEWGLGLSITAWCGMLFLVVRRPSEFHSDVLND